MLWVLGSVSAAGSGWFLFPAFLYGSFRCCPWCCCCCCGDCCCSMAAMAMAMRQIPRSNVRHAPAHWPEKPIFSDKSQSLDPWTKSHLHKGPRSRDELSSRVSRRAKGCRQSGNVQFISETCASCYGRAGSQNLRDSEY